jgi:hypothetical protein
MLTNLDSNEQRGGAKHRFTHEKHNFYRFV